MDFLIYNVNTSQNSKEISVDRYSAISKQLIKFWSCLLVIT
jgi:hypothetical protein